MQPVSGTTDLLFSFALAAINIKTRWQGAGTEPGFDDLSQAENGEQSATGMVPWNWERLAQRGRSLAPSAASPTSTSPPTANPALGFTQPSAVLEEIPAFHLPDVG